MTAHETLAGADAVLSDLRDKKATLSARGKEIGERKKQIAFDAHTKGGKAQAELRDLNRELQTLALQQTDVDSAIVEAERRMADAKAGVARLERKQDAHQVLGHVSVMREAAAQFDAAVDALVVAAMNAKEAARGVGIDAFATHSFVRRSLQARLFAVNLHSEVIPPAQRHTLAGGIEPRLANMEARANAVIADLPAKRAA